MFQPTQTHRRRRVCARAERRARVEIDDDLIALRCVLLPRRADNDAPPDLLRVDVGFPCLRPILIGDKSMRDRPRADGCVHVAQILHALRERQETALQTPVLGQVGAYGDRRRILSARQIGIVPEPRVNILVHERRIVNLRPRSPEFHQDIPYEICTLVRRNNTHLCPAHSIAPYDFFRMFLHR